jgi:MFS family permease
MKPVPSPVPTVPRPTRVRYGVLAFACVLSMVTYLDRVCFGQVAGYIQAELQLSESQVGWLFFAFAFAYAVFEIPSGLLGDLYGPRKTLIRIVLWWSLFTALTGAIFPTPSFLWVAFTAMLVVRFLFGMGEAGAYPNIARAFYNWFPFSERGSAQGAVWMAGRFAGGVTSFVVLALVFRTPAPEPPPSADAAGLVVGAPIALVRWTVVHWRHMFYIFGGVGVVWCVAFWWWYRDRPEDHPQVNAAELAHIRSAHAGEGAARAPSHANVPWFRLLTSGNLWLLWLMYFCASYGWYFNITWLPKYLTFRYGVTEETYGFWSVSLMRGAPLLLGSLACLVGGLLTDSFIRRTGNRKLGRRVFGVVGHGVCALCYFLALLAGSPWLFVLAIALAAFWNDLTMGSAWASCLDVGRRYSGVVSGCMNTVGNLGGAAAGILTGWALDLWGKELGWEINFISYGVVYLAAMCLWLRFDATQAITEDH